MAIELDNNTIVRILTRSGTYADLQNIALATGELGFTVDTERLFVGNNSENIVVGNQYLGLVTNLNSLNAVAQPGDYAINALNNTLWIAGLSGDSLYWASTTPNFVNLEFISEGIAISTEFAGDGFNIDYDGSNSFNIEGSTGQLELDSRYWSLSPGGYFGRGSLYIGPLSANSWSNLSNARVAISGPLFVKDASSQIQLSATGAGGTLNFVNNVTNPYLTSYINVASGLTIRTNGSSLSSNPSLNIIAPWTQLQGNLFVTGSAFFAAAAIISTTTVSTTSINVDITGHPSLTGVRITSSDLPTTNAVLLEVDNSSNPLIYVNNNGFVGIHTNKFSLPAYQSYSTVISGKTFNDGGLTVNGDLSATGDLIAFYTSDITLKENISPITNALEKIRTLEGVEFDWLGHKIYSGHDVGIIAQQVEKIIPEAVRDRFDGYKSVAYHKLIPLLIQAIKELDQKRG